MRVVLDLVKIRLRVTGRIRHMIRVFCQTTELSDYWPVRLMSWCTLVYSV